MAKKRVEKKESTTPMEILKVDDVAYVRFASVYRQFKDVNQFMRELKDVLNKKIK
jgi:transcriptional repressor NrdR